MVKTGIAAIVIITLLSLFEGSPMKTDLFEIGNTKKEFTQSREIFGNPLMGYAPSAKEETVSEDISLLYVDVTWKELEPERGVYDWETIEKENQFARWKSEGKHLVFRFVCDKPGKSSHKDIPDWLYQAIGKAGDWYDNDYGKGFAPDYSNETLIAEHAKAVKAMGDHWGSDSLISYIELGSLGHWGEWHVNYGAGIRRLPAESVRERYVDGWQEAFPNAMILMRRSFQTAKTHHFGIYNDMAGEPHDTNVWLGWIENGGTYDQTGETNAIVPMPDFWKRAPVGGELNSSISMKQMLVNDLTKTADLIGDSHTTFLGPKIADSAYPDGYRTLLKNMGYRIWISKAQLKQSLRKTNLTLTWENSGVAPFYKDWPAVVTVADASGTIIEEKTMDWHLSELMPGEKQTSTVELETGLFGKRASNLKICIEIRDPMTEKAAVRLANKEVDDCAEQKQLILFTR